MTRERHQRIAEIFKAACDLDPAQRDAYLARACDDESLRHEVLDLLGRDERPHPGLSGIDPGRGQLIQQALRAAESPGAEAGSTRIGPYVLREKIGEGGMGDVFAADQRQPVQRRVALKLIKAGMGSAQVVARFEAERQTLARMSHPNIAQVYDGGATAEGLPYFVMELVEGAPITDYCDRLELSTRSRIELFLDVCEGVQHAHQNGVIHRDLKPSNVLVTEFDGRPVPKIIDFGVARATTATDPDSSPHTMVGQLVGTLDYMSPEQADPTRRGVDTRSDVYSLGVMLYQLVSGLLPFEHSSAVDVPLSEVQRAIRELEPKPPSTRLRNHPPTEPMPRPARDQRALIRQLSGDLDWITLKALEKDPARRYQSATAFADDLRRHLAHEAVLAGRPGALYRLRKWGRRHRVGVAAGALALAGLVAGAVGIVSGRLTAEARAEELLSLSDADLLRRVEETAERLWPPHPDQIDGLRELRRLASDLFDRLPGHRATLEGRTWDLEVTEDRWQHRELSNMIQGIERLQSELLVGDEPTPSFGWSIERRLRTAEELGARFAAGGDLAEAWRAALPRIREAYPGLRLTPQMGLLPLGPDPDSELWEFAHLLSGARPERDPDTGRIVLTQETALVLVLVPRGTFWMGAQDTDKQAPNYDPMLQGFDARIEAPVHDATVEAFFLSKFEMTRGQWDRFVVGGGSSVRQRPRGSAALAKPVTGVTLQECWQVMHRLGLTLPNEEQWEYAARAGTSTPWSSGPEPDSLRGVANLYDRSLLARWPGRKRMIPDEPVSWSDGKPGLTTVGSLRANRFGLHDVHGNAGEWCLAHRMSYSDPRQPEPLRTIGYSRGGSFVAGAYSARISFRGNNQGPDFRHSANGLRPARAVELAP